MVLYRDGRPAGLPRARRANERQLSCAVDLLSGWGSSGSNAVRRAMSGMVWQFRHNGFTHEGKLCGDVE
jgi:hypothetical protein